ncbi:hypothetical protein BJL95_16610 [Methylomonas sp. LWB]|nr:hypothetical protein BJL95_16610 [Methylomonas sp. LWB]
MRCIFGRWSVRHCVPTLERGNDGRQLEIVGAAALLFAAQRKGLIVDAETVNAQLNGAGRWLTAASYLAHLIEL